MKTVQDLINISITEIIQDQDSGIVPVGVKSFGDLHDYVDANCYGGFCDDDGILDELIELHGGRDADEGVPQAVMDFINSVQDGVDAWLKAQLS